MGDREPPLGPQRRLRGESCTLPTPTPRPRSVALPFGDRSVRLAVAGLTGGAAGSPAMPSWPGAARPRGRPPLAGTNLTGPEGARPTILHRNTQCRGYF
jgi:hypothetical protein